MNKKIIAVFCVLILMASVFTACSKKPNGPTLKIKGEEYCLVTDSEGNTVKDSAGSLAVYIKDSNGNFLKNNDGEYQQKYIELPDRLIFNGRLETPEFTFTAPEGWSLSESGECAAKNADGTKSIDFTRVAEKVELDDYFAGIALQTQEIIDRFEEGGAKVDIDAGDYAFSAEKYVSKYISFDLSAQTDDGAMEAHNIVFYFEYEGRIYKAFYQSSTAEKCTVEQAAELFNGLTMLHYEEK